jgi:hypothetical protein
MFSPENLSTTAGAARKFTIADDDGTISVGEHMKEITEINALQHAMRVLCAITLESLILCDRRIPVLY